MKLETNIGVVIVPNATPRKSVMVNGVVYRFGYIPIPNTCLVRCTEVLFYVIPDVTVVKELFNKYDKGVFNPKDYGY